MPERLSLKCILHDYIIVLLAPVLLIAPLILRGQVLFWGTASLQFVPWWVAAWNSLALGSLPLWNPLNGMGAPLLANYQVAFFYPPNWLLLLLAAVGGPIKGAAAVAWGYTILTMLHLAWGGLGFSLLLRRLRFPWLGQVVGGLAFGLSGYIVGRVGFFSMVWAAVWLPWVIFFADQIASPNPSPLAIDDPRFKLLPGLVACFAMQLLSGHAQLTWYTMLLTAAWVTVGAISGTAQGGSLKRLVFAWLSLGVAILLAAGIAAIQLVPTLEYLRFSHRAGAVAYDAALAYSFWPWRIITLFSPDFFGSPANGDFWGYASYWEDHLYIGMLPLLLATSTIWLVIKGFFRSRRTPRWGLIVFLWAGMLVTFVLAFGRFAPVFPFLYKYVPTFSMFQAPARYLLWVVFALPILAAVGVEHWRSPTGRGLYWFRLGTAGAFAITVGAGLASVLMQNIRLTFIYATALTGVWALGFGFLTLLIPFAEKRGRRSLWQTAVVLWTLADLLVIGWSLNPGTSPDFYIGHSQVAEHLQSIAPGQRVYLSQTEETDLKFKRFMRFQDFSPIEDWRALRNTQIPDLNLLDGVALTSNFDPLTPQQYGRWINALETLAPQTQKTWLAWLGVGAVEHIDLSQTTGVRFDPIPGAQRWHWYSCGRGVSGSDKVWAVLDNELAAPPRADRAVLLDDAPEAMERDCTVNLPAAVRLISAQPDRVVFEVDAASSGWLELVDTWYPGWRARQDGYDLPIYQADGAFRAVEVIQGKHQIEFIYRPSGFYLGALFSILILLCYVLISIRRGIASVGRAFFSPR